MRKRSRECLALLAPRSILAVFRSIFGRPNTARILSIFQQKNSLYKPWPECTAPPRLMPPRAESGSGDPLPTSPLTYATGNEQTTHHKGTVRRHRGSGDARSKGSGKIFDLARLFGSSESQGTRFGRSAVPAQSAMRPALVVRQRRCPIASSLIRVDTKAPVDFRGRPGRGAGAVACRAAARVKSRARKRFFRGPLPTG